MITEDNPLYLAASTIKGDKVYNMAGEHLGKIEDIMIDLENGRIAYAVLSFGGFLGMGDKLFAIPWQAFSLRPHEHAFILNVSKEILEKAEGFDKDNWPLTRARLSTIYTYYGTKPYWETGVLERTERGRLEETETERLDRIESERLSHAQAPERRM
jgi:hypothetical protein